MRILASLLLMILAACGADGDPIRPSVNTTVDISNKGVSTRTGVSVGQGPVRVGVSF